MPELVYWIKFENEMPEKWRFKNYDEFWHRLRESFLRNPKRIDWIIYD